MKTNRAKKTLTFGEFVAGVYDTCGKQKARAKVQLAVNAHLVQFLGHRRFVVS
jgi:hypothetical protein